MKKRFLAPLLFCLLALSPSAHAWNHYGHMVVAAIAYDKLAKEHPATRGKVDALLQLNPMYEDWVARAPDADKAKTAFMMAARWADTIKTKSAYEDDGETPHGPDAARNIGYDDKLMHKYWHYVDLPFSRDGTALAPPKTPNARTQIAKLRKTLASPAASDELKSYDLTWLIHLIGDVHQPLHATSRFTQDHPGGDEGGNTVILCEYTCREHLHAYWDNLMGTGTDPEEAAATAARLPHARAAQAAALDEAKWIRESLAAAKRWVYVDPIGKSGKGPYTITDAYAANAKRVASRRIALAGARLANVIEDALK